MARVPLFSFEPRCLFDCGPGRDDFDLDEEFGTRETAYDHQRRRRRRIADELVACRHIAFQMLAPGNEGVDPHHIRKPKSRILQHRLDIAEAKLRLLLDSPRHAVGGIDPELARADQDAMSRRNFDAVAVARERGADGFGGDVAHRTGAIPYPVRRIERVRWRKDASGAS